MAQKPLTIFTVMPISDQTTKIWEGISAACVDRGFNAERADKIRSPGFIVSQIWEAIAKADIVVGEMSERNPNVFYEVGYAHALGKPTILLASSPEDLKAFDTAGFRHELHGGNPEVARSVLYTALGEVEEKIVLQPSPPDADVIYEWGKVGGPLPIYDGVLSTPNSICRWIGMVASACWKG